jgi:cytoskeleton bundling-enhancing protein CbeA-like protein
MFIFGIQPPPTYPAEAPRWGARAIYTESSFDLLYDRQQVTGGDPETRRQLVAWLNTKALPELRARAQRYELPVGSVDELVEIQSEGFCLQANPRKSYGYLYLGAWRTDAS